MGRATGSVLLALVVATQALSVLGRGVVVGKIDDTRPHNPWNTVDDYSIWEKETTLEEGDSASTKN